MSFLDFNETKTFTTSLEPASKVPIRRQRPLFESDSRRSTPALGTTQFAPEPSLGEAPRTGRVGW